MCLEPPDKAIYDDDAMTRMTIQLPDDLKVRAEGLAQRQDKSLTELIRESLERTLAEQDIARPFDPFLDDDFTVEGGPPDVAERHDDYLEQLSKQESQRELDHWRKGQP